VQCLLPFLPLFRLQQKVTRPLPACMHPFADFPGSLHVHFRTPQLRSGFLAIEILLGWPRNLFLRIWQTRDVYFLFSPYFAGSASHGMMRFPFFPRKLRCWYSSFSPLRLTRAWHMLPLRLRKISTLSPRTMGTWLAPFSDGVFSPALIYSRSSLTSVRRVSSLLFTVSP